MPHVACGHHFRDPCLKNYERRNKKASNIIDRDDKLSREIKTLLEDLTSRVIADEDRISELEDDLHNTSRQQQKVKKIIKLNK